MKSDPTTIVVKVAPSRRAKAAKVITDLLKDVLPKAELDAASVEPVFPDVTTGRRAGMMMLSLNAETSARRVTQVLESLRASEHVEYAQEPSPREPADSDDTTQGASQRGSSRRS
jgi:hypothetical protein